MKKIRRFLRGYHYKMGDEESRECLMAFLFCFVTLYVRSFRLGFEIESSIPDLYLWMLGDEANFIFVRIAFLLWFVPKVILSEGADVYFFLRVKDKMEVFRANVSSVLAMALAYGALYAGLCVFFLFFFRTDGTGWEAGAFAPTQFACAWFAEIFSVPGRSLAGVSLAVFVNTSAALFCTGLLYYLFLLIRRVRWQAAGLAILLAVAEAAVVYGGPAAVERMTFSGNLLPYVHVVYWAAAAGLCLFFARRAAQRVSPLLEEHFGGENGKSGGDQECHETV